MWRTLRASGFAINSSWIDEAGEGESECLADLWMRIRAEVSAADALILYAEADDFPLKGALIETGMAIGFGKPVLVVTPGVELDPRSLRPLGSWARHPLVSMWPSPLAALTAIEKPAAEQLIGSPQPTPTPTKE
jgi:hypothetical protein